MMPVHEQLPNGRVHFALLFLLPLLAGCMEPEPDGMPFGTILGVERVDEADPGAWVIDLDERGPESAPETLRSMLVEASQSPNGTASRHITDTNDPIFQYLEEEQGPGDENKFSLPTLRYEGAHYRMYQYLV